uniref:Uncharacterized protein n=1 Tax=Rhizophora mucronata TaxID=61149 RepID=A0A2P2R471_RHIMU
MKLGRLDSGKTKKNLCHFLGLLNWFLLEMKWWRDE